MGSRRKARESALQMLFAADVMSGPAEEGRRRARPSVPVRADELVRDYWAQLGESDVDEGAREFATRLVVGALANLKDIDERIKSRAEHWRISRMAVVDRNVLRLAVYEFLFEPTPRTVIINEALEVARRFSSFEATQFINGILDAIKRDLDRERPQADSDTEEGEEPPAQSAAAEESDEDEDATEEPEDDRGQSASVS